MRQLRQEPATLNPVRRRIGERLRATYGEMMMEPVPNRHLELLQHFECVEATEQVQSCKRPLSLENFRIPAASPGV
jgi:hypothetical protein